MGKKKMKRKAQRKEEIKKTVNGVKSSW